MASPLDRLRVLDARLQRRDDPYPPLSGLAVRVGGVLLLLGLSSLVVALSVLARHPWLQVPFFIAAYFGIWPLLGRLVMRCRPRRYARRLLWLGSLPGRALKWPLQTVLHSPLSRECTRMLPPDEKLMAYEPVGALTAGSVWVVSDKALYVWPIAVRDPAERSDISRYPFDAIRGIYEEPLPERGQVRRWIAISASEDDEPLIVDDVFPIEKPWRIGDLIHAGVLGATGQPPRQDQ